VIFFNPFFIITVCVKFGKITFNVTVNICILTWNFLHDIPPFPSS
jgi:hypothetical protein